MEDYLLNNIHAIINFKINTPNPCKNNLKDLNQLINAQGLEVFDIKINIKKELSKNLNEVFYNRNILN